LIWRASTNWQLSRPDRSQLLDALNFELLRDLGTAETSDRRSPQASGESAAGAADTADNTAEKQRGSQYWSRTSTVFDDGDGK
jgi:hypothetical protein